MSWFSQDFSLDQNKVTTMSKSSSPEMIPILDTDPCPVDSVEIHSAPSPPRVAPSNCAGCYRRKIKCDRQLDGCFNCAKANVKCTYPRQEQTVRQKRGPYHKDPSKKKNFGFEQKISALEEKLKDLTEKLQSGRDKTSVINNKVQAECSDSPRDQFSCASMFYSDSPTPDRNTISPGGKTKSPRISEEKPDLSLNCTFLPEFGSKVGNLVSCVSGPKGKY